VKPSSSVRSDIFRSQRKAGKRRRQPLRARAAGR
jgi:hypothetical protein